MPLPYLIIFVPMALALVGAQLGGTWNFITPIFIFGLIPIADHLIGENQGNPAPDAPASSPAHRFIALLSVPVLIALVGWSCWLVTHRVMTPIEWFGLALSVGICTGGIGITVAHELIHKSSRFDRTMGQALLLNVGYMHFYIEHLIGHHSSVATPEDPASARLGESFYRFYFRSLFGSWTSAWHLETQRLSRQGLPTLHWRNQMLWFAALPITYAAVLSVLGWQATAFYVAQCFIGFSLLELVNYLEHYGLERQQLDNGRYERVTIMHSWSSCYRLSNYLLFNLQRHSDHHVNAAKPYQNLKHFPDSPQLPTGYSGMALLALVPPLFRKVMDPRVANVRAQLGS